MIPRIAVALVFVGLNLYVFRYFATTDIHPDRLTFATFPRMVDDWRCSDPGEMAPNVHRRLGVTDYLLCDFHETRTGDVANVYIGYHASQTRNVAGESSSIHPPEHCLPGGGWDIIDMDIVTTDWLPGGEAKRAIIAKGNLRALVYFWYQSRGRVIARNHEKILYMFVDRATKNRTDGSLVRITVPVENGGEAKAEETVRSLAEGLAPLLPEYLPE